MTEYEIADLALTFVERTESSSMMYLTLVSGYLLAAYAIGAHLTKSQVTFVSVLFFVFAVSSVLAVVTQMDAVAELNFARKANFPDGLLSLKQNEHLLGYVWAGVQAAGIVGCLWFMWSIRHPKIE
jgi:hypothetical protein